MALRLPLDPGLHIAALDAGHATVTERRVEVRPQRAPGEVADFLGLPIATLAQWRYLGKGPKSIKVGRHIRCRPFLSPRRKFNSRLLTCWFARMSVGRLARRVGRPDNLAMKHSDRLRVVENPAAESDSLLWSNAENFPLLVYGKPEGKEREGWWLFWRDPMTHEKQSRYVHAAKSEHAMAEEVARQHLDDVFGD